MVVEGNVMTALCDYGLEGLAAKADLSSLSSWILPTESTVYQTPFEDLNHLQRLGLKREVRISSQLRRA